MRLWRNSKTFILFIYLFFLPKVFFLFSANVKYILQFWLEKKSNFLAVVMIVVMKKSSSAVKTGENAKWNSVVVDGVNCLRCSVLIKNTMNVGENKQ